MSEGFGVWRSQQPPSPGSWLSYGSPNPGSRENRIPHGVQPPLGFPALQILTKEAGQEFEASLSLIEFQAPENTNKKEGWQKGFGEGTFPTASALE